MVDEADLGTLSLVKSPYPESFPLVSQKPSVAHLRCSRAHLVEPHAVTQCARAHIKYTVAYRGFMFCILVTLRPLRWARYRRRRTQQAQRRGSARKKTKAKRETSGRNRALFAGAAYTWARSSAVTYTKRREPGVRAACTWARSCTVINAERSKPGSRSMYNCVRASLFLFRDLFGVANAPSQMRAPHARGQDQVP